MRSGAVCFTFRQWSLVFIWVALTAFAYETGRDVFFRISYLIAVVVLVSLVWAAYSVLTFQLERRAVTPRVELGRSAEDRFLVRNVGWLPNVWIEIFDYSELPGHRASRVLNAQKAGTHWGWSVRTPCHRRGRFRLGPIMIAGGDPFGLFVIYRRLPNTIAELIVYPATVSLPTFAPSLGHLPGGDALHNRTHNTTTNVSGTREYVPGDSFNRIHWRSSARMERLIVKEFELDPAADVWLFLDLEHRVQAGQPEEEPNDSGDGSSLWMDSRVLRLPPATEEYGITIAASIAKFFLQQHRTIALVTYGSKREVVPPDRGERQLNRLLEVLAVLRAEGTISFDQVLAVEGGHLGRSTTLVAITSSVEPGWGKSLQLAKRRGLNVVAVLVDPTSFGGWGDPSAVLAELLAAGIPSYLVGKGDDLVQALGH